jgi:hypothetical protein
MSFWDHLEQSGDPMLRRLLSKRRLSSIFYFTMLNTAGVVFGAGLYLKDLWTLQVNTWFSVLHPVILYFAIQQYIVSQKPRKVKT